MIDETTRSGRSMSETTMLAKPRVNPSADAVTVTVSDNGEGVKPELLPHIFERGVSDGGTGLGLPICKEVIDAHNGKIFIESEYGMGTAVTFTLPVYTGEELKNG